MMQDDNVSCESSSKKKIAILSFKQFLIIRFFHNPYHTMLGII